MAAYNVHDVNKVQRIVTKRHEERIRKMMEIEKSISDKKMKLLLEVCLNEIK